MQESGVYVCVNLCEVFGMSREGREAFEFAEGVLWDVAVGAD